MNKILKLMVSKYAIEDFDWMNFRITKENPLTFHHIKKEASGGEKKLENGAPLTVAAQEYLHLIERYNFKIYRRINRILSEINAQEFPPTQHQLEKINGLLLEFEARHFDQLKKRLGLGKYDKFNATLERIKVQEGKPKVKKKTKMRRKSTKRN